VKASAQLPLVDPDFRFVERRPEMLHAYARGLLQHLRDIRAGEKAGGYPIATIKAAVAWLIESYAEAVVASAPEAALLVREIVGPHGPSSRYLYHSNSFAQRLDRFSLSGTHLVLCLSYLKPGAFLSASLVVLSVK